MIKLSKNSNFAKLPVPNGFFWYNCKFYNSKIEKQTLSLSQFSLVTGFSEGMRKNIFHIFRTLDAFGQQDCLQQILIHKEFQNLQYLCNYEIINKLLYQKMTLFMILLQFPTNWFPYRLCVTEKRTNVNRFPIF